MSNQDMEMQFADPDWQPASSRQQLLSVSPENKNASDPQQQRDQSGSVDTRDGDKSGVYGDYSQGYQAAPSKSRHTKQSAPAQQKSQKGWPLFGLFTRVALVAMWAATPYVNRAFHGGWLLPVLGVLFLPCTALTYAIVFTLAGGVTGWNWLWIAGALLLDFASYGSQASKRKSNSRRDEN
jgi:hypothetical protein